jgi:Protein of unknown function, DUF547
MHTAMLPSLSQAAAATACKLRLAMLGALVLMLSACSTVSKVSQPEAPLVPLAQAERNYAAVLQRHVNDQGEVDFAALQQDKTASGLLALESYVQAIAATPLNAATTPEARLAHMINSYNALSMYNIVASGIPTSHAGLAKVKFFVLRKFDIGGKQISLYDFENDIIRKLGEPRIHFALNCSAVSCPVLPRIPFTAAGLNEELDREAREFFAKPENLRIDHDRRTVFFNEILKFYTEDFTPAHAPSLIAYAQRYSAQSIPVDYKIAFTPYDWTVANSQRKR